LEISLFQDIWWQHNFWLVECPSLLSLQLYGLQLRSEEGMETILRHAPNLERLQYSICTLQQHDAEAPALTSVIPGNLYHDHLRRVEVWVDSIILRQILQCNLRGEQACPAFRSLVPPEANFPGLKELVVVPGQGSTSADFPSFERSHDGHVHSPEGGCISRSVGHYPERVVDVKVFGPSV